jgi:hypothetical protein
MASLARARAPLFSLALVALTVAAAVACGRTSIDEGTASTPLDAGHHASLEAGTDAPGAVVCGSGTCGATQMCVDGGCVECDNRSCAGCCQQGQCVSGTDNAACGAGGVLCLACPADNSCHAGTCYEGTIVLFGGRSGSGGQALGDTWTFDGVSWTRAATGEVTPPARFGHAMATYGVNALLFGGEGASGPLGDTWIHDGTRWTAGPTVGPPPRSGHVMVGLFSVAGVFGGRGGDTLLDDTWAFDGKAWTQQLLPPAPSARSGAALVAQVDTNFASAILVGGLAADGAHGDLWELWPSSGGLWSAYTATGPSPRSGHALATLNGDVYLFGGRDAAGNPLGDTWMFDGIRWNTMAIPGPPARAFHAMATLRGAIVLFGGLGAGGAALGDTWLLDGKAWSQVPATGPSAREEHAMATAP